MKGSNQVLTYTVKILTDKNGIFSNLILAVLPLAFLCGGYMIVVVEYFCFEWIFKDRDCFAQKKSHQRKKEMSQGICRISFLTTNIF